MSPRLLTIIAPCFNEAEGLPRFVARVREVTDPIPGYTVHLLLVDDGSTDATPEVLAELAARDPRIQVLRLTRNFGHQRAITAGLDHAQGDCFVVMDADLQDPPEAIPEILARLDAGFDLVHTVRVDRSQDSAAKRWPAKFFYLVMRRWVLPALPENAGDYKGFNRRVLDVVRRHGERMRFLRGIFATAGYRQTSVPIVRAVRHAGASKFPPRRVLRFARDAIVSYTVLPLRAGFYLGLATLAILPPAAALGLLAVALGHWRPDPALAAILLVVPLFGGLNLVFTGLLGEYLKCLIVEAKQRPLYVVRDAINLPGTPSAG
jgi:glycosyltransferase involved in cell wall biosynthesis